MKRISRVLLLVLVLTLTFSTSIDTQASNTFDTNNYIAHAAGAVNDVAYTNSKEALVNTLTNHIKAVELDFKFTSDGILVCTHDWKSLGFKKRPTYKQFCKAKVKGRFTPMSAKTALSLLNANNAYLIVDVKEDTVLPAYKYLNRICKKSFNKYLRYIVPQVYSKSDYKALNSFYNYENYIFTIYRVKHKIKKLDSICKFCKSHNIRTLTMRAKYASAKNVQRVKSYGLNVAIHGLPTEDQSTITVYKTRGVTHFYLDNAASL